MNYANISMNFHCNQGTTAYIDTIDTFFYVIV
jgi:hypothetical protein